jgi:hypothetical protein
MVNQWYYARAGKLAGPASPEELSNLADSGQLSPTDLVWKEGMQTWVPADGIKGLFTATLATPVPPVLPPARPVTDPARTPAITLVVAGGLLAIMALFQTVVALAILQPQPAPFTDGDATLMILRALLIVLRIVPLALSVIVIYGGIAMLKHTNYGLSIAAAISAIVGGVLSFLPGWVLVAPVGIWAFVVLRKPDVKQVFPTANRPSVPVQLAAPWAGGAENRGAQASPVELLASMPPTSDGHLPNDPLAVLRSESAAASAPPPSLGGNDLLPAAMPLSPMGDGPDTGSDPADFVTAASSSPPPAIPPLSESDSVSNPSDETDDLVARYRSQMKATGEVIKQRIAWGADAVKKRARALKLKHDVSSLRTALNSQLENLGVLTITAL